MDYETCARRNPRIKVLDCWAKDMFEAQLEVYGMQGWHVAMNLIIEYGQVHQKEAERRQLSNWKKWAAASFLQGARAAHNLT